MHSLVDGYLGFVYFFGHSFHIRNVWDFQAWIKIYLDWHLNNILYFLGANDTNKWYKRADYLDSNMVMKDWVWDMQRPLLFMAIYLICLSAVCFKRTQIHTGSSVLSCWFLWVKWKAVLIPCLSTALMHLCFVSVIFKY